MCVLHIEIRAGVLDDFLRSINLPAYQVYRKGEEHLFRKGVVFEYDYIKSNVSEKAWNDFDGQVNDIIDFLDKYKDDLDQIKSNSIRLNWFIDLPYYSVLDDEIYIQNNVLPAELLCLLGEYNMGINLSLYSSEC